MQSVGAPFVFSFSQQSDNIACAGPYAAPWFPKIHGPAEHPGPSWVLKENERYYEARAASIAGGTDEIQRNIIAKQVLRL